MRGEKKFTVEETLKVNPTKVRFRLGLKKQVGWGSDRRTVTYIVGKNVQGGKSIF